jgi:hypothetical protein
MAAGINRGSDNILKKEAPGVKIVTDNGRSSTLRDKILKGKDGREVSYSFAAAPANRVVVPRGLEEAKADYALWRPHPEDHPPVGMAAKLSRPSLLKSKPPMVAEARGMINDAVARRHEVDEAREHEKAKGKKAPNISIFHDSEGNLSGRHENLAVIGRESNLVNQIVPSSPWVDIKGAMTNLRNATQETHTHRWGEVTKGAPYASRQLRGKELKKLRSPGGSAVIKPQGISINSLVVDGLKRRQEAHFYPKGQEPTYGDSPAQGFKEKVLGAAAKLKNQAANIAGKIRR